MVALGLFSGGRIVATPGALDELSRLGENPVALLRRHFAGDWGDLDGEDKALNDAAVEDGSRLLSAYVVKGEKFWVITEAADEDGNRVATTVLLPSEY